MGRQVPDDLESVLSMKPFTSPAKWIAEIDADATAALLAAAADLALVLDRKGIVRDVAFQSEALADEFADSARWMGRPWAETVTVESRPKVAEMLQSVARAGGRGSRSRRGNSDDNGGDNDNRKGNGNGTIAIGTAAGATESRNTGSGATETGAATLGPLHSRQINYPGAEGADVPMMVSVVPLGRAGGAIAFGRDLRSVAALQQRLLDVQQSLERDFAKLRQVETRYRILFQMSAEPVLVVDAKTRRIVEANPAAQGILASRPKLVGRDFGALLDEPARASLDSLLATVRAAGRADEVGLRLADGTETRVAAFLFRQGEDQFYLLRVAPETATEIRRELTESKAKLLKLIERAPDGFVVTGPDGKLLAANTAFLDMAQVSTEEQAVGESLDRWLGRPGVDLSVLLGNLREHGSVRLYPTEIRDNFGGELGVEISAVTVMNGGKPCFGFAIRNVSRRAPVEVLPPAGDRGVPRSLDQISELIGRVSLKDIVRETTDVIERLSIEAALNLTGDNRASAAEMLGLSRQSLYVKMRRYGLMQAGRADA